MNKLSFKELIEQYIVEIPMIQRDYAYGRNEEDEKRDNFLRNLRSYFYNTTPHELDFIYGSIDDDGKLILLDGQQRITTLFLLHWYLSLVKDSNGEHHFDLFKSLMFPDGRESRFTYRTRFSSSDFCNALVSLEFQDVDNADKYSNLIENPDLKLSTTIKKEKWFLPHWCYDPTIISMLNMIDAIHCIFKANECDDFFMKLFNGESIVFNFLDLKDFNLTDELYIKMNSRGRPLTRFENLKSKMLKLYDDAKNEVPELYASKLCKINEESNREFSSLRDYVSLMLDTKWTDIFWNQWLCENKDPSTSPNIDIMMLNFISVIGTYEHILYVMNGKLSMGRYDDNVKYIDYLMGSKDKDKGSSIRYEDFIKLFKENNYSFLFNLIDYFNNFYDNGSVKKCLPETFTLYNEYDMFKIITADHKNDRKYEDKVKLFAYIKYIFNNPIPNINAFSRWMKFVCNVCANSYRLADRVDTFCSCLAGINYLYAENIESSLPEKDLSSISTLDKSQIAEEILKMQLARNPEWYNVLNSAETKLSYFEGRLSYFLTECAGVYTSEQSNDTKLVDVFERYVTKASAIFPTNSGCPSDMENDFIRAMLAKGDYLRVFKGGYSLLGNFGRDNSWRRLLKEPDSDNPSAFGLFKDLIDDNDFNINYPKESLKTIASKRDDSIDNWRKAIIDHPQILEKINNVFSLGVNRCIRWNNESTELKHESGNNPDNWEIDLLEKVAIFSTHAELFSLCKYIELKDKPLDNNYKIDYYTSITRTEQPYLYVSANKKFVIGIMYQDNNCFLMFNDCDYSLRDNSSAIIKENIPYDDVETAINSYLSTLNS